MSDTQEWPEPIIRVQSLAASGAPVIPDRYVKPPSDRAELSVNSNHVKIPIIDLHGLEGDDDQLRTTTLSQISMACREWGFFQIVNHGVKPELMHDAREVWRQFFHLPVEEKQVYANTPATYEGYGSRLGVQKGAILDWNDYFFLHCLPQSMKDSKRPAIPTSCSQVTEEYSLELVKVCQKLLKAMSTGLGLDKEYLQNAFGREEAESCMRVNFYPKCPQPELTLGLSPHSDPGGITLLLPDPSVSGLQVRKGNIWVTVEPEPDALVVNMGDQIQVLSNAIYKSVDHRAIVNSAKERVSIAFFYNPKSDLLLKPAEELVRCDQPALYSPMTFSEYRAYIRTKGPQGKSQVEALISSQRS